MRRIERGGRKAIAVLAGVLLSASGSGFAADEAVEPAVVVQAVHLDRQVDAVLRLFEGARARNPAEAMAAWRRATNTPNALGKPIQAAAALFNPEMVPEWRTFHRAELAVGLDSDGGWNWLAVAPEDEGTLAAVITSLRLSGGADEPPLSAPVLPVERLGEPGAALGVATAQGTAFASRRPELGRAVGRLAELQSGDAAPEASGFHVAFDTSRLRAVAANPTVSRIVAGTKGAGLNAVDGFARLEDQTLGLDLASRFDDDAPVALRQTPPVAPEWLSWLPADDSLAAVAVSVGRDATFWDALFDVADRIDRADPARAELQPLRVRLNLLAMVRGLRPEVDLWPVLQGVSLGVLKDPGQAGVESGVIIALHTESADAADRIHRRLASALRGARSVQNPEPTTIGTLSGRSVDAVVRGSTVVIGWGDRALATALKSAESPERSARVFLETDDGKPVSRAGVFWPGRWTALDVDPASPLSVTLAEAAPVVWRGGWEDGRGWDVVRWGDLRRLIARFLERVPQEPSEVP